MACTNIVYALFSVFHIHLLPLLNILHQNIQCWAPLELSYLRQCLTDILIIMLDEVISIEQCHIFSFFNPHVVYYTCPAQTMPQGITKSMYDGMTKKCLEKSFVCVVCVSVVYILFLSVALFMRGRHSVHSDHTKAC